MAFELTQFDDTTFTPDALTYLVDRQAAANRGRHEKLASYFHNPLIASAAATGANGRAYVQAQERGLPPRITGCAYDASGATLTDVDRKEVVIENDIAWRVDTMVDYLFGQPVAFHSDAENPQTARTIEQVVAAVVEANGGMVFLQELALLGAVHGYVDVALRLPAEKSVGWFSRLSRPADGPVAATSIAAAGRPGNLQTGVSQVGLSKSIPQLEIIDPSRVVTIGEEDDHRQTRYWVQVFDKLRPGAPVKRRLPWGRGGADAAPQRVEVVEILSATWWQRYEDRQLIAEGPNPLGVLPVVHFENLPMHGTYGGASDVEPLIPLQDELNTRLSDRANRVTYQSFKMYLGKGIDDFLDRPVGPGQMWTTHNADASIEEFGHDAGSPSEDAHITQIRQAMDKTSGVTPIAAGLIEGAIGNLTSAAALRVVLSGLLSKTARKRLTYGEGLGRMVGLVLSYLDTAGVFKTAPADRRVTLSWPNPLPMDEAESLRNAQIKAALGVPADRLLAELGYDLPALATDESDTA